MSDEEDIQINLSDNDDDNYVSDNPYLYKYESEVQNGNQYGGWSDRRSNLLINNPTYNYSFNLISEEINKINNFDLNQPLEVEREEINSLIQTTTDAEENKVNMKIFKKKEEKAKSKAEEKFIKNSNVWIANIKTLIDLIRDIHDIDISEAKEQNLSENTILSLKNSAIKSKEKIIREMSDNNEIIPKEIFNKIYLNRVFKIKDDGYLDFKANGPQKNEESGYLRFREKFDHDISRYYQQSDLLSTVVPYIEYSLTQGKKQFVSNIKGILKDIITYYAYMLIPYIWDSSMRLFLEQPLTGLITREEKQYRVHGPDIPVVQSSSNKKSPTVFRATSSSNTRLFVIFNRSSLATNHFSGKSGHINPITVDFDKIALEFKVDDIVHREDVVNSYKDKQIFRPIGSIKHLVPKYILYVGCDIENEFNGMLKCLVPYKSKFLQFYHNDTILHDVTNLILIKNFFKIIIDFEYENFYEFLGHGTIDTKYQVRGNLIKFITYI